ncbi:MAG: hypothetical protein JRJ44_01045 [Deltaproteobacteria bacterium]|nr:hypothetical protein [Deltaproteobacteria bacterium]
MATTSFGLKPDFLIMSIMITGYYYQINFAVKFFFITSSNSTGDTKSVKP